MGKDNYLQRVNTLLKDNGSKLISAFKLRTVLNSGYDDIIEDINELSKIKTFDTIEALEEYALNNPTAYSGQICTVKGNPSNLYVINSDKTISPIDVKYNNDTPIEQSIGGIEVGDTFEDVSIKDMFDKLLYPYQVPLFNTFSINGISILECGTNLSGNKDFLFTFSNSGNIKSNSLSIYQDLITLISNQSVSSPKNITVSTVTKTVDAQYVTMKVEAENTKNILFSKTYTINWYMPYYFGVGIKGLNVANIQLLTKTVTSKSNINKTYNTSNQVPYLAYPKSRGMLTSILDKNGYETISDFIITERTFIINGTSVLYYVYEFNNLSTASNLQVTYKY